MKQFLRKIKSLLSKARDGFDIRDFLFFFGGVPLFGYGLWLFRPWVGFASTGLVLMVSAYAMRGK